jgi:prepilin-type processing-associated H-X9-DG protein
MEAAQTKTPILDRLVMGCSLVMFGAFVCWLLLPRVGSGPIASRAVCKFNLQHIYLALQNYHKDYESLPPAVIYDAQGRPMHSWRVLLMPYLDNAAAYNLYRFNEPWNSPHNRRFETCGQVFQCPNDAKRNPKAWNTSYVACVGKGTLWPPQGTGNLEEIRDDRATTIMLVERSRSNIHWMEPADWDLSQVTDPSGGALRSEHARGGNVVFADGSAQFLDSKMSHETFTALTTIAGGETIEEVHEANQVARFVVRSPHK